MAYTGKQLDTKLYDVYTKADTDAKIVELAPTPDLSSLTPSYLKLPSGTTAQRPVTPSLGDVRVNTDSNTIEFYNGTIWRDFNPTSTSFYSTVDVFEDGSCNNFWRLDNNGTDEAGNNNLTLNNITFTSQGKYGHATLWDGSVSTVYAIADVGYDSTSSMSCWYYHNGSSQRSNPTIIDLGSHNDNTGYGVWTDGGNTLRMRINTSYENNYYTMSVGTWYHLVVTYNGSTAKFYVDGVYVNSLSGSANSDARLVLGNRNNGKNSASDELPNGRIDQVRYWTKTLTDAEVEELYQVESQ